MPWIERPLSIMTSCTSSNLRTRQESISGKKNNDEFQLDDVKKCFEVVAESWVEIGRVLLSLLDEDSSIGSCNRSPPSEDQRSPSKHRRSTPRSPSPKAKSHAAVVAGKATGAKLVATRRSTTRAAEVSASRRNGPKQHRSLSPQPMAVPTPSSPLSADRRKSPPPRRRSPTSSGPRSSPASKRPRGPQKQQRFKTMSPTRTSKRTASKVTMVSPHSSTPMGIIVSASPRSSPLNPHGARGGGRACSSAGTSTGSWSHTKCRITVRNIETKRKSHQ